ncbi:MAG: HAD superfamily hydrolase (TIGR01549 family) [Pseudohongiellaceae bacterium]|jgi:HAD superfamily hydrolase (TIGR01549 family)
MLKALFLDLDETLCDTLGANETAKDLLASNAKTLTNASLDGHAFAERYVAGIYREWNVQQAQRYTPVIENQSEESFRLLLIQDLLAELGFDTVDNLTARALQTTFDAERLNALKLYPGIEAFLLEARKFFTLVVITNGPEYSQTPKIAKLDMAKYVDHIIIGGQEPEQKPAKSIFQKALRLAKCEAHEAIHVGDNLSADIAGAHSSGITSVWIQHQQPLDAELGINPHHTVMHPHEIPELIRSLHIS